MRMWSIVFLAALACAPAVAAERGLEVEINNDSAQGAFSTQLSGDANGRALLNFRFLYNGGDPNTGLGSVGLDFAGRAASAPDLELAIGGQAYAGRGFDENVAALGLGARIAWRPSGGRGLAIGGKLFYAPKIFAWSDSDSVLEAGVRAGWAVTPKVEIYLGYQYLRADLGPAGKRKLDNDLRVGFAASF